MIPVRKYRWATIFFYFVHQLFKKKHADGRPQGQEKHVFYLITQVAPVYNYYQGTL